jgi:hypothetical protein
MNQLVRPFALVATVLVASAVEAQGEAIESPHFELGDRWTYRQSVETPNAFKEQRDTLQLTRTTSSNLYLEVHVEGSSQPARSIVMASDWSRVRSVNGEETVVAQPMNFPLSAGKSWKLHYREEHPNARHGWEDWTVTYTVVGHETVQVPAGSFDAIKIEGEGRWTAEVLPSSTATASAVGASGNAGVGAQVVTTQAHQATGRTYKVAWYVPAVKRWVKSVEEYYGSGGIRNERYVSELESFSVR